MLSALLLIALDATVPTAVPGSPFVANRGQWAPHIEFVAMASDGHRRVALRAERGRLVVQREYGRVRDVIEYAIEGAEGWSLVGQSPGASHHVFRGADPAAWIRDVESFEKVVYRDQYGNDRLRVHCATSGVALEPLNGAVQLHRRDSADGTAATMEVTSSASLETTAGIAWSTYFGGALGWLEGFSDASVSLDGKRLAVAGWTNAPDFPVTPGAYTTVPQENFRDVALACFDAATGTLLWSTAIGGGAEETSQSVTFAGEDVVFAANSQSTDFPTTDGAYAKNPIGQCVVAAVSADGAELRFSTYFHGSRPKLAVRGDGTIAIGGHVGADLPATTGAFDPSHNGGTDGFVAVLDSQASSVLWSTHVGTADADYVEALTVLPDGAIAATGRAGNALFPTTPGAYVFKKPPLGGAGGVATFVTVLEPDGSALRWSSMIGGAIGNFSPPQPFALAAGPDGRIALAGQVKGPHLPPSPFAAQPSFAGSTTDGFVLVLAADGSALLGGTYIGSAGPDYLADVAFDASGLLTFTGQVGGEVPLTTPPLSFGDRLHVGRLDGALSVFLHSQRIGGNSAGVAVSPLPRGRVAIAGVTHDVVLPTPPDAAFPNFQGGQSDGIVLVHSVLPAGVVVAGRAGPPCDGSALLGAVGPNIAGSSTFALYASQSPASAAGWLLVGLPVGQSALWPGGPALTVDLGGPLGILPFTTDASGYAHVVTGLPAGLAGVELAAQAVFASSAACDGAGLVWTHGLRVIVGS